MSAPVEPPEVDLDLVLAEVHAEAAALRARSPYRRDLERELDAAFRRHTPADIAEASPADALTQLDAAAAVAVPDLDTAPRPGRAEWKRFVLRVAGRVLRSGPVARVLRLATSEIVAFNAAVVRFLRNVDLRLRRVEAAVGELSPALRAEVAHLEPTPTSPSVLAAVRDLLADVPGRVVHLGCGRGELVRHLDDADTSCYGVDPRRALQVDALRDGLDIRPEDVLEHVRQLPDGSVGAVVIGALVDRTPVADQLELVEEACRVVVPGGPVVVALTDRQGPGAAAVDLLGGRPLSPSTWVHLLERRTGTTAVVREVDGATLLAARTAT